MKTKTDIRGLQFLKHSCTNKDLKYLIEQICTRNISKLHSEFFLHVDAKKVLSELEEIKNQIDLILSLHKTHHTK